MKKFFTLFLLFWSLFLSAQNLNDYKYAIVPSRFDFLKEKNQFMINTYTKMFMQKYGFETYLDSEELPDFLLKNNCNKVFVDVISTSTFFQTKLKVVLKDCKKNVLYMSPEGKSKEKDYKTSYYQALREAFNSFALLKHVYNGKDASEIMDSKPAAQLETKVVEKVVENKKKEEVKVELAIGEPLFAKPFGASSFQLLTNNTAIPRLALTISKTSVANVYIATRNSTTGVLVQKNLQWFFEYYTNNELKSEPVTIVNFNQ